MTDAYAYASEGHRSPEIEKLNQIERFGLEAITGRRVFLFAEHRRMITAEEVVILYNHRQKSKNWAEWAASHPAWAEFLANAERLYNV